MTHTVWPGHRFWPVGCGGLALLSLIALSPCAGAAEIRVRVEGLRSRAGDILVAVCPEAAFLTKKCAHVAKVPAAAGIAVIPDVAPGRYAVQAVHDEDGDGQMTRSGLLPDEGFGFSRDAPIRFGPPRFADAAIELREPGVALVLTMRYLK